MYIKSKHKFVYEQYSAKCFGYESHLQAEHIIIAIPLQGWRGPEGSRRLRLPDFKTIGT
jgi:hypothetical protein